MIRLDRRLFSATVYPADYGFIPDTLGEDGDPLDALVLLEDPTFPGCWIAARPVGVFWMEDDKGPTPRSSACPPATRGGTHVARHRRRCPSSSPSEIEHFFDVYKMLEPGKWADVRGFEGAAEAKAEIVSSLQRATDQGYYTS